MVVVKAPEPTKVEVAVPQQGGLAKVLIGGNYAKVSDMWRVHLPITNL